MMRNQDPKLRSAWPPMWRNRPATCYESTLPPPFGSMIDSDSSRRGENRAQQHPPGELGGGGGPGPPPVVVRSSAYESWWDAVW